MLNILRLCLITPATNGKFGYFFQYLIVIERFVLAEDESAAKAFPVFIILFKSALGAVHIASFNVGTVELHFLSLFHTLINIALTSFGWAVLFQKPVQLNLRDVSLKGFELKEAESS